MALLVAACGAGGPVERDAGVASSDAPEAGDAAISLTELVLVAPMGATTTYLVDREQRVIHRWESADPPALGARLLADGALLRTASPARLAVGSRFDAGGAGGRIERLGWDGELEWAFELSDDTTRLHHDATPLANGHVLVIAWEHVDEATAESLGRPAATVDAEGLWTEAVLELAPRGADGADIVWEWHARDHLGSEPHRIDLARGGRAPDVMHLNSVELDTEHDEVIVSAHGYGEIWVIDHHTTTEEARTSAGDLLYRWGNPAAYGTGGTGPRELYGQHDARVIPRGIPGEGHITIFDNGLRRPDGSYSRVLELAIPRDPDGAPRLDGERFAEPERAWEHTAPTPTDLYAENISSAQRLASGNTLVCAGTSGWLVEVTPDGETTWELRWPLSSRGTPTLLFRAELIASDHPGLAGRSLEPMGPLE